MKFLLAILAFLLIGGVLGWGIVLMVKGQPLFLVVATVAYIIAFAKFGCMSH